MKARFEQHCHSQMRMTMLFHELQFTAHAFKILL